MEGKALVGCHFSVWQRSFLRFAGNTGWAKSSSLEFAHLHITFRSCPRLGHGELGRKACCVDEAILNQLASEKYQSSDVDIHAVLHSGLRVEGRDWDKNDQVITRLGTTIIEKVRENAPENLKVPRYLGQDGRQRQHIWTHLTAPSPSSCVPVQPSCGRLAAALLFQLGVYD